MTRSGKARAGFSSAQLLAVVAVLAMLGVIVLPRVLGSAQRGGEMSAKSDLHALRQAIALFASHTSAYPASLDDLAAPAAPASGLDSAGNAKAIYAADWNGPYLASVPTDPISGRGFAYYTSPGDGHRVGEVRSSAVGRSLDGTPYSSW